MATGTERIVCNSCKANNMPGQASCWKCGSTLISRQMQAPAPPRIRPIGAPSYRRGPDPVDQRVPSRTGLAIFAFLFPLLGAIGGLYLLTKTELINRERGRHALLWSGIGLLVWLAIVSTGVLSDPGGTSQAAAPTPSVLRLDSCTQERWDMGQGLAQVKAQGTVTNLTDLDLSGVVVVVTWHGQDGGALGDSRTSLDVDPLPAHSQASFSARSPYGQITDYADVTFEDTDGRKLRVDKVSP